MTKILISDAMDNIAEKILTSNNFDVEVKTNFTNEELVKKISLYDGLLRGNENYIMSYRFPSFDRNHYIV